jgi:predicted aconitase/predicted aconitase with swiveling domain
MEAGMSSLCQSWRATGTSLVDGLGRGKVLFADVGLSFWGGVNSQTGEVIDRSHPLCGQNISGKILAIPSGRGSCSGSSVLMELILNGNAPAGMIFSQREEILSLGVFVADEMFGQSIPMVQLAIPEFAKLGEIDYVTIDGQSLTELLDASAPSDPTRAASVKTSSPALALTRQDQMLLDGSVSKAAQIAMRIIVRMAGLLGAERLIDVTQAHIDGCIYTGKASLEFAQLLCEWGAKVRVPTTLNAISVDQRNWRSQGTDPSVAEPASDLADAYVRMGAQPTFTCAPYQLASAPSRGENIVWAESNAVVYANSVLGARTMKYPDYLDICIALTGRAPLAGCHIDANRRATLKIVIPELDQFDDSFYPLLGYHVGALAPLEIPVVVGLENASPSLDDLKAFGAAFGTTSGAPMFHILGVTPEALSLSEATGQVDDVRTVEIKTTDLADSWYKLNSATENAVDLVSLGNPHFSEAEFERLASLCLCRKRHPEVAMVVTCGRTTYGDIVRKGITNGLRDFGVRFVVDACWCTVVEPIIPPHARTIITNSGKYAHYGPGLSGRKMHFASLAECVEAACAGQTSGKLPAWLLSDGHQLPARRPVS